LPVKGINKLQLPVKSLQKFAESTASSGWFKQLKEVLEIPLKFLASLEFPELESVAEALKTVIENIQASTDDIEVSSFLEKVAQFVGGTHWLDIIGPPDFEDIKDDLIEFFTEISAAFSQFDRIFSTSHLSLAQSSWFNELLGGLQVFNPFAGLPPYKGWFNW
jgi:hypothetical protein